MKNLPSFPTIEALHASYATGINPRRVIRDVYRRIDAAQDPGIFIAIAPEGAAAAAIAALGSFDPRLKPLWGIPFAVKDNIDVAGFPTTAGCPAFAYTPQATAPSVQRLLDAGAILIGKTNLDQFATGLVGVRTPYPVPRNSIDPAYVPGGSSSGSAVAVARGIVSFALGTDTAGSGRVPAGLNNIVGMKPSLGAISGRGVVPACRTAETVSIFAGTVDDADVIFRVIAAYDHSDPWSRRFELAPPHCCIPPNVRIGVPDSSSRRFGNDTLSANAFETALADLRNVLGSRPKPIDITPLFAAAGLLYGGPWVAERYHTIRHLIERSPEALHPVTRTIIGSAKAYSAVDAFAGVYRLAELRRAAQSVWEAIDVLVVPTFPRPRTLADLEADPIGPNNELGTYSNFVNLLDLCALAVPARFRKDGFPASITLIAPAGRDGLLAALGARLHALAGVGIGTTTMKAPEPTIASGRVTPAEIELAVVGAHLSGMPLNHELADRGARFLRAAVTSPDYRLFALPGGPPFRPGLMRVASREGGAIVAEVWAIAPEKLGGLVACIAEPLSIGTVRLADGTTPKGFIVESEGIKDAKDITSFGGWRAYMERDDT